MTHTVSFTNARYTNLQTLNLTEHSHLLRSFDTEQNEHVLIRVFRTSNEAEQSYILTEAAALAKLASPHIATLYDVNITAHNEPYIAFENLQHIPLDTVPHGQFTQPQFIIQMAASLLSALAPLHAQMRALLCLSPASVRLADEESPVARIALDDWRPIAGDEVARAVYGAHNQYAAPELALQLPPDARADLYSIGIILYEIITGQSFNDMAMVDSAGMLSHLVLKSLRDHAPALPDALVQWIYGLLERDRSMRFFSVREALEYLAAHGLLPNEVINGIETSPVSFIPVNAIGMETAFAAVVNVQSPFVEAPVLEISGEPGLGKTMLLRSLLQSRMQSTTLLRHKIVYCSAKNAQNLPDQIADALGKQEPTLFLVDDAEQMPENARLRAKDLLTQEETVLTGIRLVATHRSQLPRLATKPTMLTLTHFASSHIPLFCAELLGRCAFTPEFYRQLYGQTKGHPLTIALVLRGMVRNGVVTRRNRIWTHQDLAAESDNSALSPGKAALEELRGLQADAQMMLCAVAASLQVTEELSLPKALPVSLHLLAEMLDTSTQSALRRLLPLIFDGYVQLHNSAIEWTHEIFREAALATFTNEDFRRFTTIAQELVRHRFPQHFPTQTPPVQEVKAVRSADTLQEKPILITPASPAREITPLVSQTSVHEVSAATFPSSPASPFPSINEQQEKPETATGKAPELPTEQASVKVSTDREEPLLPLFLTGNSSVTALFRQNVQLAAQHDVPCLIESVYGSDREEIAAYIHAGSLRRQRPFHAISCSDFEAGELEAYLFGTNAELGLFAASEGGTILLDEISAVPTTLQTRLARFTQAQRKHGKIIPPARQQAIADVRLLVGFTINGGMRADAAMRSGLVANELFFAFSGMRVLVPSLAERSSDAPLIAQAFAESIAEEYGITISATQIPSAFWQQFATKSWIADMTELEANCRSLVLQFDANRVEDSLRSVSEAIFASALTSASAIHTTSQRAMPATSEPRIDLAGAAEDDQDNLLSIDDAQKEHILRALDLTGGNKTKAAEMLKIKRTTLLARMKKFGLMP